MSKRADRDPIDVVASVRAPTLDVPSTVALGIKLLGMVPKQAPPQVKSAARAMRAAVVALQTDWGKREAAAAPALRPLDIALDNSWSGVLARLESWESVAAAHPDEAKRAADLVARIFPTRLDFTRLELAPEWAESDRRLKLIAVEGMEQDLTKLAGAPFLNALRDAHAALGRALGLDGRAAPGDKTPYDLAADLRTALRSIAKYALQLVAADDQVDDATSQEIRLSLAAIDASRTARTAQAAPPAPPPVTPTTPVPDVPAP